MNHGAAGVQTLYPIWTQERRKSEKAPAAAVGRLGTISDCIAGDVVACESQDDESIIYLQIAWQWPDGQVAAARLYDFKTKEISLKSEFIALVRAPQRVRWLGVRAR